MIGNQQPPGRGLFPATHRNFLQAAWRVPRGKVESLGLGARQICSPHLWDPEQFLKTLSLLLLVCKIKTRLLTSSVPGRTEKGVCELSSSSSGTQAFSKCGCLSFLTCPLREVWVVLPPSLLGDSGWSWPCFHWKQGGHPGPLALFRLAMLL